ncbi:centrosomal protein 20 [Zerene cesonia]|uniref:centrosomal protein 20 n=1 Tax=Zerene cesonia TaxID=33412 RepID=UPI0018E59211|nr:centrosomal protein 20 [Zerene cesonia]
MSESKGITEKDLVNSIKNILRKSGHLNKFQAEMRAKVTEILQDRQVSLNPGYKNTGAPKPSSEVLLINELIREYLEWNGYLYTASVMSSEAGMTKTKRTRGELCAEVGVKDDEKSSTLPLLSNIIAAYSDRIKRKINKVKRDVQ